jgi:hypothetical protein
MVTALQCNGMLIYEAMSLISGTGADATVDDSNSISWSQCKNFHAAGRTY